jgi:hypothetical protein
MATPPGMSLELQLSSMLANSLSVMDANLTNEENRGKVHRTMSEIVQ